MIETIILLVSYIMVFYHKGFLFGLGFLIASWLVIGNIIKALFKGKESVGSAYFWFAVATGALSYFCSYML